MGAASNPNICARGLLEVFCVQHVETILQKNVSVNQVCYRADVIDCDLSCLLQPVRTHCNRSGVANIPVSFCYIRLIQR